MLALMSPQPRSEPTRRVKMAASCLNLNLVTFLSELKLCFSARSDMCQTERRPSLQSPTLLQNDDDDDDVKCKSCTLCFTVVAQL